MLRSWQLLVFLHLGFLPGLSPAGHLPAARPRQRSTRNTTAATYSHPSNGRHQSPGAAASSFGKLVLESSVARLVVPFKSDDHAIETAVAWVPAPPYRMWAFPYNLSAVDGCATENLYPNGTYNLVAPPLGPDPCNTTQKRAWYRARGARCMSWSYCWNMPFADHLDNDTVIESFKNMTLKNGEAGDDSAIVMDECGEIYNNYPGHDAPHRK